MTLTSAEPCSFLEVGTEFILETNSVDLRTDSVVFLVRLVRGTDGSRLSGIRFLETNSVDMLTKFRFHVRGVHGMVRESAYLGLVSFIYSV